MSMSATFAERWLVTGAAGFVGSHVCRHLVAAGRQVTGVDNLNDYYDTDLKRARLDDFVTPAARSGGRFTFARLDVCNRSALLDLVVRARPQVVVHLAAQAGVRHSLEKPAAFVEANLVGFGSVLEACRQAFEDGYLDHLVFASSSSVYGGSRKLPFDVHDPADHPVSLYAATKRANELMAHAYSDLHGLPATGLRFFTIYGPWGRPDMAYWRFTEAIVSGAEVPVYGDGSAVRDFTYVDDVVEALVRVAAQPAQPDPSWDPAAPDIGTSSAPWRLYNIGHGGQATVNRLIDLLEMYVGRPARRHQLPTSAGDVAITHAETADLAAATGYVPVVTLEDGLERFVRWYLERRQA